MQSWNERKRLGTAGVVALLALARAASANVGVTASKLLVIDRGERGAKAVFVTHDPAIDKGDGTDMTAIGVTLEVTYDNGVDPSITGQFAAPIGSPYWRSNLANSAKYVNVGAPAGGSVRRLGLVSGAGAKLVAKSPGDMPLALRSQTHAHGGTARTALCIDNGVDHECFCTTFDHCTWEWTTPGTGTRLDCRDGVADPTCEGDKTARLRFTTSAAGGTCGSVRSGGAGGTVRKALSCGGINLGGGFSTHAENPIPAGASTVFDLACQNSGVCTILPSTADETGDDHECSDTGCQFGTYLPIYSAGTSLCVQNRFSAPASGTVNALAGTFDGSLPLTSVAYLTANATYPCPPCVGGTPGVMDSGTCLTTWTAGTGGAPNAGDACTPVDAIGNTYDCVPPPAAMLPAFAMNLTAVTTGTASLSAANGVFCPSQFGSGAFGCSGSGFVSAICPGGNVPPLIDYIGEQGAPAGFLLPGRRPATLASVFCLPTVGGSLGFLLNGAFDFPGPGAISLPGTLQLEIVD